MNRKPEQNMSDVALTLHGIIKESPGIHFRSLGREAGLSSVGQLRHHLDALRRRGVIIELQDGRFKRFFAAGEHNPRLRDGLARFARRVPRRIAKLLLSQPMNRTEIRRRLNCADSTLGYHLNRMVELGDLERSRGRNCCVYSLTDPEFVRYILQNHPAPAMNKPPGLDAHGQGATNGANGLDAGRHRPLESATGWTQNPSNGGNGNGLDLDPAPRDDAALGRPSFENGGSKDSSRASPASHPAEDRPGSAPELGDGGNRDARVAPPSRQSEEKPRDEPEPRGTGNEATATKRVPRSQETTSEVPRWLFTR